MRKADGVSQREMENEKERGTRENVKELWDGPVFFLHCDVL